MNLSVYDKYEYMNKRQIFTALLNVEKNWKDEKWIRKSLIDFLKARSKK